METQTIRQKLIEKTRLLEQMEDLEIDMDVCGICGSDGQLVTVEFSDGPIRYMGACSTQCTPWAHTNLYHNPKDAADAWNNGHYVSIY